MENYIQNIALINNYLDKALSKNEILIFENRLKTDSNFKTIYDEHIVFLEGLKRQKLKTEIKHAKQSYIRNKWFKYLGLTSGLLILLSIIYFNTFNLDKDFLKNKLNFESEYVQNFNIATDSIIEIVGEKGTVIRFNPNDLKTTSSIPFTGDSLKIELIELTTKQDLLLANAQTVSNGKWLISGGAFKIDIKANNKPLVLKEGKTISIKLPKNTLDNGMNIFYGERNKDEKMNWDVSSIKLTDEKFYTILSKDSIVLDEEFTKQYGVDTFKNIIICDTLGYLNYENIIKKFPEIKELKAENDTLRIYDVTFRYPYEDLKIDDLFRDTEVPQRKYISISKNEIENIIKNLDVDYFINEKAFNSNSYTKVTNSFYKSIELSKLGWINIDKFARDEETVKIKLEFSVKTNFNEIYIVDQTNNTILNVSNNEIDLPINRSFDIIAIGLNKKDIYGFKKSLRVNKSGSFKIDYKKINEKQIKSFFKL